MWGCDRPSYKHHFHHKGGLPFLPLFFLFGLMFWGGLHWLFWAVALWFIVPMIGSWAFSQCGNTSDVIVIRKEKRKNDFVEKAKNEPGYFRTKDGEWLEIID